MRKLRNDCSSQLSSYYLAKVKGIQLAISSESTETEVSSLSEMSGTLVDISEQGRSNTKSNVSEKKRNEIRNKNKSKMQGTIKSQKSYEVKLRGRLIGCVQS